MTAAGDVDAQSTRASRPTIWGQWWGIVEGLDKVELTLNIDRQTPGIGRIMLVQREPKYTVAVATIQFQGDSAGSSAVFVVELVNPEPAGWNRANANGSVEIVDNARTS